MTGDVTKLITSRIFQRSSKLYEYTWYTSYIQYIFIHYVCVCTFNVATAIPAASRLQDFVGPPHRWHHHRLLVRYWRHHLLWHQSNRGSLGNCTLWTKKCPTWPILQQEVVPPFCCFRRSGFKSAPVWLRRSISSTPAWNVTQLEEKRKTGLNVDFP